MKTSSKILRYLLPLIVLLLLLALLVVTGCLTNTTYHLVTEIDGSITEAGQPVVGVEVVQTYWPKLFYNEPQVRRTKTDENGKFSFPAVDRKVYVVTIFDSFVDTKIKVFRAKDGERRIWERWYVGKEDEFGELRLLWIDPIVFPDDIKGSITKENHRLRLQAELLPAKEHSFSEVPM